MAPHSLGIAGAARRLAAVAVLVVLAGACRIAPVTLANEDPLAVRSVILAADGTELATLFEENRSEITYEEIPKVIQEAVIASEDAKFWTHSGVDVGAIARAFTRNLKQGEAAQGGSTISQQLAKLMYSANAPRTLKQKIIETRLAAGLEERYSKQQILTMYLNRAYFGQRAYGIAAAAETYFAKSLDDLTLGEAALLVGLVKAPTTLNPFENLKAAKERRRYVTQQMVNLRMISQAAAEKANDEKVSLKRTSHLATTKQPHWIRYIEREVLRNPVFGKTELERASKLYRGGLRIVTTLNPVWQKAAEQAARRALPNASDPEVGLVSLDPRTGALRAIVGGRDFLSGQYDVATQGQRQAGSAFKPFVLAAALEQGISPESVFQSGPGIIPIGGGQTWKFGNYGGSRGAGSVTIRHGMRNSYNGVFARLVMKVGPGAVVDAAHRAGITSHLDAYPSISLGALTIGVTPLEMASAFGTFANNGLHFKPHGIAKVTDSTGKVLFDETKLQGEQRLDPNVAYGVTDVLRDVACCGTARRANVGRPMAAKTGTTDDHKDTWLVGYTPAISTAVWVGHRIPRPMGRAFFGGSYAAKIWHDYMIKAVAGTPVTTFVDPPGSLSLKRKNGAPDPNAKCEDKIDPSTGLPYDARLCRTPTPIPTKAPKPSPIPTKTPKPPKPPTTPPPSTPPPSSPPPSSPPPSTPPPDPSPSTS